MDKAVEIYCYIDPNYSKDLDQVLSLFLRHKYRVIKGDDLDKLPMLLQISQPAAIVYTLVSEETILSESFQTVAHGALEQKVPIILVGPGDPIDGLRVYYPEKLGFDKRSISLNVLIEEFEKYLEKVSLLRSLKVEIATPLEDRIGDGSGAVQIETKGEIIDGGEARIATSVLRHGAEVVREEQVLEDDDFELVEKMKSQHTAAVHSYAPPPPSRQQDQSINNRGEGNQPFLWPEMLEGEGAQMEQGAMSRRLRLVVAFCSFGVIVSIGSALVLSSLPTSALPEPVTRETQQKVLTSDLSVQTRSTRQGLAGGAAKGGGTVIKKADRRDRQTAVVASGAIPFPGSFRQDGATFLFKDKWEEQRFISMIKELPKDKRIYLVGHPTDEEALDGRQNLGYSRAWAVQKYLERHGIDKSRMKAFRGKRVPIVSDLDTDGNPRNRWVDVVTELSFQTSVQDRNR